MKISTEKEAGVGRGSVKTGVLADPERTLEWLGAVNYLNLENVLGKIKGLMSGASELPIYLMVNSFGGTTGVGMSFYDAVRSWLRTDLVTIGSGDVDSSGIIVLLSGNKRYITRNTTLLLHLAGRTLDQAKRFSSADLQAMVKEDMLKDYQYACILSDASGGRIGPEKILDLMSKNTLLTAEEAVNMGFAHAVLG